MRRVFSKEFKRDAISLVIEQGYSRAEASRSLGIHAALLNHWVRGHSEDGEDAFQDKEKSEQEEICQGNGVKYSFIAQHKKTWSVDVMCSLMGINRNSYYCNGAIIQHVLRPNRMF